MMKVSLLVLMVLAMLISTGCSRQDSIKPTGSKGTAQQDDPRSLSGPYMGDPNEILISVNGKELTRGEALRQVRLRLGGPPPADMPPERVAIIQNQVLSKVVDEFVRRELLLQEADRRGIEADEEEIEKAIARLRERTPDGRLPTGILQDGPAGKDSLRSEVIIGIRIEKLLGDALPEIQDPSDEDVSAFIETHREKLTMPERVEARHILVEVSRDATEEERAQRRELAESYRQKLLEGADFAELATRVSSCPSADRGGNLGVFPRGKMAKSFEDAAFRQNEGEIGDIIETQFGYHIIRVEKRMPPGLADTAEIAAILRQRARTLAIADYVRALHGSAEIKHSATVRPPGPPPQP